MLNKWNAILCSTYSEFSVTNDGMVKGGRLNHQEHASMLGVISIKVSAKRHRNAHGHDELRK